MLLTPGRQSTPHSEWLSAVDAPCGLKRCGIPVRIFKGEEQNEGNLFLREPLRLGEGLLPRSKKRHIRGVFDRRRIVRKSRFGENRFFRNFKGNYGAKVGILGDGAIGAEVIKKLKEMKLDIYVFSITMTEEKAENLRRKACGA